MFIYRVYSLIKYSKHGVWPDLLARSIFDKFERKTTQLKLGALFFQVIFNVIIPFFLLFLPHKSNKRLEKHI